MLMFCHAVTYRTDAANIFGFIIELHVDKGSLVVLMVFQLTHDG